MSESHGGHHPPSLEQVGPVGSPQSPPVQTTRGEGCCCTRHEFCPWGFALKPELEPKLGSSACGRERTQTPPASTAIPGG